MTGREVKKVLNLNNAHYNTKCKRVQSYQKIWHVGNKAAVETAKKEVDRTIGSSHETAKKEMDLLEK